MKGLYVLKNREGKGDYDRYSFALVCTNGFHFIDLWPSELGFDNAEMEQTLTCDGENNYVTGMWGDRWRDEHGDKDSFEFGIHCADNSFWTTGLGVSVGNDPGYEIGLIATEISGMIVGAVAGAAFSCAFFGCAGSTEAKRLGLAFGGAAAVAGYVEGVPRGGGRAHGTATCSAGLPPRAIQEVNFKRYRKSNGDWDTYDFRIKCAEYETEMTEMVRVFYETCHESQSKWAESNGPVYAYLDTDKDKAVQVPIPKFNQGATIYLPRIAGPAKVPRRTTTVTFYTEQNDGWCVADVIIDGVVATGAEGVRTTQVWIDGPVWPEGERSNYTWVKPLALYHWDSTILTYESCSVRRQLEMVAAAPSPWSAAHGRLLGTPSVKAYTADESNAASLSPPSAGSLAAETIYGYDSQMDNHMGMPTGGNGGYFNGTITLVASGGDVCLQNVGLNGRALLSPDGMRSYLYLSAGSHFTFHYAVSVQLLVTTCPDSTTVFAEGEDDFYIHSQMESERIKLTPAAAGETTVVTVPDFNGMITFASAGAIHGWCISAVKVKPEQWNSGRTMLNADGSYMGSDGDFWLYRNDKRTFWAPFYLDHA